MNDVDRIFYVLEQAMDLIFKEDNLPDNKEIEKPKEEIKEDMER